MTTSSTSAQQRSVVEASDTSSPSLPADTSVDQTYYTWSTFFSILTGNATTTERNAYFATKDTLNEARDCARCDAHVADLFRRSPIITFLKHNIDMLLPTDPNTPSTSSTSLTASIGPHNVRCRRCTTAQSGGFSPDHGILLCANHFRDCGHTEDTLAHEMVHAYDHLRFKLDPHDLRHAACMEIRASALSGECRFSREFWTRGQWGNITQQLQECVRRRATLSVMAREKCAGDKAKAERVVDEVWGSCFNDTRPFDEIYK